MATEKETVFVVDDDREVLEMITSNLEAKGFAVATFEGGQAAFEALANYVRANGKVVRAVISDWMMPQGDGIELLGRIRKDASLRATPFILMSGAVTRDQLVGASKYDPDAILVKPFSLTGLQQKIQQAFEVREAKELSILLKGPRP